MNVTLTVDVGDEERVLLVPKHEDEYAKVGTVAEVTDRIRLPGGGRAVALNGLHRGVAGAAASDAQGRLFVEVEERPDQESADGRIRELEREYRATVEEILELRGDDGRIAAFVRSITEPGRTRGHLRLFARPDLRAEDAPPRDRRRARAPRAGSRAAARAPCPHAGAPAHPGGRRDRRREAAARVHPPPPAGLDPQGARRGRGLGRRGVPHEDRRGRDARERSRAGRARAVAPRAHGRPVARGDA